MWRSPFSPAKAIFSRRNLGVLKVLAQTGGIAAIHAEDNELVMHIYGSMSGFPDDLFRGNDG